MTTAGGRHRTGLTKPSASDFRGQTEWPGEPKVAGPPIWKDRAASPEDSRGGQGRPSSKTTPTSGHLIPRQWDASRRWDRDDQPALKTRSSAPTEGSEHDIGPDRELRPIPRPHGRSVETRVCKQSPSVARNRRLRRRV
ncbi:MAG: hypothetical protein EBR82_03930 [Caulobacteraceae bacterium]|nr:hypothetical protein [Caulobacteraceae bacterium]